MRLTWTENNGCEKDSKNRYIFPLGKGQWKY